MKKICKNPGIRPFSDNLMNWLFRDFIQTGETGRRVAAETLRQMMMMLAVKSFTF